MKILYDLTGVESSHTFRYDARLISIVKTALITFLIISSLSVFSGIRSHTSDYTSGLFFAWRWCANGVLYFCFSLLPDIINAMLAAWIVSALLRKDTDKTGRLLIAFCSVVVIGLTYYSFSMSKNSAVAVGNDIEKSNQISDSTSVKAIDQTLFTELSAINDRHSAKLATIQGQYSTIIGNTKESFAGQKKAVRGQISNLLNKSTKKDYLYANKKIERLQKQLATIEAAERSAVEPIEAEQRLAIITIERQQQEAERSARDRHEADRSRTKAATDHQNTRAEIRGGVFTSLFSNLAAYSIFIVLILTSIRGVLYHRNDIEPVPVLSNFDFSPSWTLEVLAYPYFWIRSRLINWVRGRYENLPNVQQRPYEAVIFDGSGIYQQYGQSVTYTDQRGNDIEATIPISSNMSAGHNKDIIISGISNSKKVSRVGTIDKCIYCGEGYTVKQNTQKYCSNRTPDSCQMKYHAERNKGKQFDPVLNKLKTK